MASNPLDRYRNSDNFNLGSNSIQELDRNPLATKFDRKDYQSSEDILNMKGADDTGAKDDLNAESSKLKGIENKRKAASIGQAMQNLSDIMASNTQLVATEEAAETNKFLMNYQKSLALNVGMQAALDRTVEGEVNAGKAALSLAAQGQNLSGAGAEKVLASYRAIAYENAVREEAKMYAEIAGYDIQLANLEYDLDMAQLQNQNDQNQGYINAGISILGSTL